MAADRLETINIDHVISRADRSFAQSEFDDEERYFEYWDCLVLAPNGKLYCPPSDASQVLCIDPTTKEVSMIGDVKMLEKEMTDKYKHAVLAENGCIYAVPVCAQSIMKIDTNTDTISFIEYPKEDGACRCILGLDGNVYFVDNGQAFQLNPSTDTVAAFGPRLDISRHESIYFDVLADNGKIYAKVDSQYFSLVVIDPLSKTVERIVTNVKRSDDWEGVKRADGTIAYVDREWMFVIDPKTNVTTLTENPFSLTPDELRNHGQVQRAFHQKSDDRMFEITHEHIWEFSLKELTYRRVGLARLPDCEGFRGCLGGMLNTMSWGSLMVGSDGCMYGSLMDSAKVIRVDARSTNKEVTIEFIGPAFMRRPPINARTFNQRICKPEWGSGLLAGDEKIYCLPIGTICQLLVIDTSRWLIVGGHILLRSLVEKGRAQVERGRKKSKRCKVVATELELMEFVYTAAPQGVFTVILSFL